VASWTGAVFLVVHGQLRWELRPKAYAITGLAFSAVSMIAIAGLVAGAQAGVAGVFAGQAIGSATGIAVAIGFARQSFGFQLQGTALARLLAFSAPLVPATFAAFLAGNADRFAISRLIGNSDVAVYGVGYRVASVVGLAVTGFQLALTPLIYARHEHKATPAELARVFRLVLGLGAVLWMGISLFAPEIIAVLATPTYAPSAGVVPYLAGAVLVAGLATFAPGLAIAGHTGLISLLAIATALGSVALNIALVPVLGIEGAAAAALISSSAGFVATMTFSQRHYPIPYRWPTVGVAVAIAGAAVALDKMVAADGAGSFLMRGALLLAATAAYAGLGLLPLPSWNSAGRRHEDM
jgi:O-antigen/teichoic acid export membrane protein